MTRALCFVAAFGAFLMAVALPFASMIWDSLHPDGEFSLSVYEKVLGTTDEASAVGAPRENADASFPWGAALAGAGIVGLLAAGAWYGLLDRVLAAATALCGAMVIVLYLAPWEAVLPHAGRLLVSTLRLAVAVSALSMLLGTIYGYLTARVRFRARAVFEGLMLVPFLIPTYVSAVAWMWTFQADAPLNRYLARGDDGLAVWARGLLDFPSPDRLQPVEFSGFGFATFVLVLAYWPLPALLAASAFAGQSADQEEAALITMGRARAFLAITLRRALPAVLIGGMFVFLFTLSNYAVPNLLRIQTYTSEVFAFFNESDFDGATAACLPLLVLMLGALAALAVLEGRRRRSSARSVRRVEPVAPRWRHRLLLALMTVLLLLSVAHPLVTLLDTFSGKPDVDAEFFAGLDPWRARLEIAMVNARRGLDATVGAGEDLTRSLLLGLSASVLVTTMGVLMAVFTRGGRGLGRALDGLVLLPLAIPALALGVALIRYFNANPRELGLPPFLADWRRWKVEAVYGTAMIVLVGAMTRFLPFAYLPVRGALRAQSADLDLAARLAGVSWPRRVWSVICRPALGAIAAAAVLVFVLTVMELDLVLMVRPASFGATLPERIFNAVHFGRYGIVAGWCLMLIVVIMFVPLSYRLLTGKRLEFLR